MTTLNPYAEEHKVPKGRGDARPTALKIIQDQHLTDQLSDKVILITGCSAGLGVETAKALATTGATLYLTARSLNKAKEALGADFVALPQVHLLELDLTSLESVRACAATFLQQSPNKLNILITNAGIRNTPFGRTKDGFEQQFGVCHLAHFLLFSLLKPALLASSTPDFHSRVVALTSSGHRGDDGLYSARLDDPNYKERPKEYTPSKGYAMAKLSNIYMTNEINRRYAAQGLNANSVMPGGIMTGLQQGNNGGAIKEVLSDWRILISMPTTMKRMKNPDQGAATTVWGAIAKELEGQGGFYLENCGVAAPQDPSKRPVGIDPGYSPKAMDEADARKVWALSCELVGVKDE